MPPKTKVMQPIDRPLSRAYLREFSGWSTAEPPGISEPTSLRLMENVIINRDGSAGIRPGLRYLSYSQAPNGDGDDVGLGATNTLVGTMEPFYLNNGTKGYLQAVREDDDSVGFRVLVLDMNDSTMYALDDNEVGFEIPQTQAVLNFTSATTYVNYLQIDNKIFALSDAGETMRVFSVGEYKVAKKLSAITRPDFSSTDKLSIVHPEATWINGGDPLSQRINLAANPSFEEHLKGWNAGASTEMVRTYNPTDAISGNHILRVSSTPARTNLASSPLHDVATTGIANWYNHSAGAAVSTSGSYLRLLIAGAKGIFYCRSKQIRGVQPGQDYRLTFDAVPGSNVTAAARVDFEGVTGTKVGESVTMAFVGLGPRIIGPKFTAPAGAVSLKIFLGGNNQANSATHVDFKDVVLCPDGESTAIFHGGSGANYFWEGDTNDSTSTYHPPATISITSDKVAAAAGEAHCLSVYALAGTTPRTVTLDLRTYNKNGALVDTDSSTPTADTTGTFTRMVASAASTPSGGTQSSIKISIAGVTRGDYHYLDAVLLEPLVSVVDDYFDGSTANTSTERKEWVGEKHNSSSRLRVYSGALAVPTAETRTADTLIAAGGASANEFRFGFFYSFNNEVGESAASDITMQRTQRAWVNWVWETPNAAGEPSGTETKNAFRAADQLVAYMPEAVYDQAMVEGATSWNLYIFTWSDQDAAPVQALKVGTKELQEDEDYQAQGWMAVTPDTSSATDLAIIPSKSNRYNYSEPSRGGQGLVAGDRMVMVNDPTKAAVVKWSSNRQGEYTNFSANKGGGYKTLTSGNLYIPACVKLWQNPQSADTITILCLGTDGYSNSYYMAPAQIAAQSEATNIFSFEETTATPGTTSPYGVEIFNNSMYHPIEEQLMKSTASNYNINHKSQSEAIRNMWEQLATKYWIMSAQHDSRLYYLVNNPKGSALEDDCKGNEIWVFDAASEKGTWSRLLIQGHSLRKLEFGGRIYMSVTHADGVYILDPEYGSDDYVGEDLVIESRAIPWLLETNTQGANRAHDAWAHLQQIAVTLGNFQGRMRYGLRSVDLHGKSIDMSKIVKDTSDPIDEHWDIEDQLLIRRDLREWYFYASSIVDEDDAVEPSFGQINLVQYRYTPSTVNTGYELGSVETFQYGRDVAQVATNTVNGIPLPLSDVRRP